MTLAYNLILLAVDLIALVLLGWTCRLRIAGFTVLAGAVGLAVGGAALFLGVALSPEGLRPFSTAGLGAYGVFLHGPLLLLGTAAVVRRRRPKLAVLCLLAAAAISMVAFDAFLVEPTWLEVSHRTIESPKLTKAVRLVVVADLQTENFGPYEKAVLRRAMDEKPDLILLAGDYVQAQGETPEIRAAVNAYLREIGFSAPGGVYAVRGNIDGGGWDSMFAGLPITAVQATQTYDVEGLRLTCLSLADSFNTNLQVAPAGPGPFRIVLGHIPNFALGSAEADLLVAGHTHGGQVRLPWIGAMMTNCAIPRAWASGLTALPGGARLLVPRGIGMERGHAPRMRFFCRPELAVVDLVPRSK